MSRSIAMTFEVERPDASGEEQTITLDVDADGAYDAGRLTGPPDLCYPPEGKITEIRLTLGGQPWAGELTDAEQERLEEKLYELLAEPDDDYDSAEWYDEE